ncbi:MAG: hypothetical protein GEU95_09585 [Rhizobiales bacterium]|nr:hypothetical protein [Hyphomicrobiales bacterium]
MAHGICAQCASLRIDLRRARRCALHHKGPVADVSRREAFDLLCGLLSVDESPELRERLGHTLRSGAVSWPDVVAIASEQWVSAAVWPALRRKSLRGDQSREAMDYFEGMATLNRQRNSKLRAEAIELAAFLNRLDVTPIFLKGSANLLSDLYPDPAMRIMLDLDVLVPPSRVGACAEALQKAGYVQLGDVGFPAHHHYPPLGRPDAEASVELHIDPLDIEFRRFLSFEDVSRHAVTMAIDGARLAVPTTWCRLVHGVAHTQFVNHAFAYGHLPLRDLLDSALLSRSGPVDWDAVVARFSTRSASRMLAFQFTAARQLLGGDIPEHMSSMPLDGMLFKRALFQIAHPPIPLWIERLLRPFFLLRRSLSHGALRRRLARNLFDPAWYRRQWRMVRQSGR